MEKRKWGVFLFTVFILAYLAVWPRAYAGEISKPFNERVEASGKDYEAEDIKDVWLDVKCDFTSTRRLKIRYIEIHIQAAKMDIAKAKQSLKNAEEMLKFWERTLPKAYEAAKKVELKSKDKKGT